MWRRRRAASAAMLTSDGRGAPVHAQLVEDVTLVRDLAPARWVEESMLPWPPRGAGRAAPVGSVVPACFGAYLRVDHRDGADGLAPDQAGALLEVLLRHTSTGDAGWICVWEGWGGSPPEFDSAPKVSTPARGHVLLRGSLRLVETRLMRDPFGRHSFDPSLFWPDDRAWCVASDTDLAWSYVGGSADCIAAVGEAFPDAVAVRAEDPVV